MEKKEHSIQGRINGLAKSQAPKCALYILFAVTRLWLRWRDQVGAKWEEEKEEVSCENRRDLDCREPWNAISEGLDFML